MLNCVDIQQRIVKLQDITKGQYQDKWKNASKYMADKREDNIILFQNNKVNH